MKIASADININNYNYFLPDNRIALYPLSDRDHSKLLIYKNNKIEKSLFYNITDFLPENSFLIFNNTKVIQARLLFRKNTGSSIEIFCLEPVFNQFRVRSSEFGVHNTDFILALQQTSSCQWNCLIGNAKRWKRGNEKLKVKSEKLTLNIESGITSYELTAEKVRKSPEGFIVEFKWKPENIPFSAILENAGLTPLPPYIKRNPVESDKTTYQTIYAKFDGSVAAPTAGLHFTENIFEKLKIKNIQKQYLTLHVGTGTFKPVTSQTIDKHEMHREIFSVEKDTLIDILNNPDKSIIPVGTTSLRTIESLYWAGVKMIVNNNDNINDTEQWDAYRKEFIDSHITIEQALTRIIEYMEQNNIKTLKSATSLLIIPGYEFKIVKGLITNFHQPKSTLLLLIAAFIGDDWKKVYDYALVHDYRFLSYGDCCLFLK